MRKTSSARGICQLPDQREFVAVVTGRNAYILFAPEAWKYGGTARYVIHADVKILSRGASTRWSIRNLSDTGRTVEPR
jgi:hypothetical protein